MGLVKRFLKEEAYIPARDIPLFYKVYDLFPDQKFWQGYTMEFQLNSIAYFLSEDGKNKLKSDIALFNLDMPVQLEYNLKQDKVGEDVIISKPKRTMADLLK